MPEQNSSRLFNPRNQQCAWCFSSHGEVPLWKRLAQAQCAHPCSSRGERG